MRMDMTAGNSSQKTWLGIDIGGTKCAVILGTSEYDQRAGVWSRPDIAGRKEFATAGLGDPFGAIKQLSAAAEEMILQHERLDRPVAVGISCGSPLDSRRGLILSPPNLPGWDNVPITGTISDIMAIPAFLLNDADAGALAEWRYGSGQGFRHLAFITFGTGFGAGLILNGRLYSGIDDGAGEVGHVRIRSTGPVGYGKSGSLEGFCSGGGIAQLAQMKAMEKIQMGEKVAFLANRDLNSLTAKIIGEAADAGDSLAREILRISGEHLGRGLAILLDLLNLECIVIGSIFCRSYKWIWPAADRIMARESLARTYARCQVRKAGLGEQVGDIAALTIAVEGYTGRLNHATGCGSVN